MEVLIVVNNFNVGGLERVVINLIKEMHINNIKPYVACLEGEGVLFKEIVPYVADTVVFDRRSGVDIKTILKLRSYIKNNNITAVHSHNLSPLVYAGLASKLFLRSVKHIYTEHNQVSRLSERGLMKFRWYLKLATSIVTVSGALKDMFEKNLKIKNVNVIYNGIKRAEFECEYSGKVRREFGFGKDDYLLCLIGILKPQKGVPYLLQAMVLLEKYKNIKLLIAGDGVLMKELTSFTEDNNLSNVVFAGYRKDLCEIYADTDLIVMSSIQEGLPMTLIEGLAAGKPMITTNVGGCSEVVVDGENGLVVDAKDPELLKEAIVKYYNDPPNADSQKKRNIERFDQLFSVESMFTRYMKLYQL